MGTGGYGSGSKANYQGDSRNGVVQAGQTPREYEKDDITKGTMEESGLTTGSEAISQMAYDEALDEPVRIPFRFDPSGDTLNYRYGDKVMQDVEMYIAKEDGQEVSQWQGVPSLFNTYTLFRHPLCDNINDFLIDDNNVGGVFGSDKKKKDITIGHLLGEHSPDKHPSEPYYASDFLYSKYYRKIPLNKLITLRRFPFPTFDNLDFNSNSEKQYAPLAQAITYIGEEPGNLLSDMLKINGQINWTELAADVHDVEGNEVDFGSSTGSVGNFNATKNVRAGSRTANVGATGQGLKNKLRYLNQDNDLAGRKREAIEREKFNDFNYTNKVLGPVNVVHKTLVRDRGIGAELAFPLVFEYQMKSFHNINPKLAMLDLVSNMLALTFNNAKFWGGANRYFPKSPQFAFMGDQDAYYRGDYGTYMNSLKSTMGTGLGSGFDMVGKIFSSLAQGDMSALKQGLGSIFGKVMDVKQASSRPQVIGFKSLISGLPVGEWHVVVGNPFNPFAKIGNLVVESWNLEFSNEWGVDDFPEEMKFTVNLKSGRPRDKGDLESILAGGEGRTYYPPSGFLDVTNKSAATGTEHKTRAKASSEEMKRAGGTVF